jgi:hypothetical protein
MSHLYDEDIIKIAEKRGFDKTAHTIALAHEDEDEITKTHPANWLTEFEVEVCTTLDKLEHEGLIESR